MLRQHSHPGRIPPRRRALFRSPCPAELGGVRAAIAAIPATAPETGIAYPRALWDGDQLRLLWVSGAEVAGVPDTPRHLTPPPQGRAPAPVTARLIVRRVRDKNPRRRRAGRAVPRLALPRRVHRQPIEMMSRPRRAKRPRHHRAGLRRLEPTAPSPTCRAGSLPRQRRVARLRRHQRQPAARRRRAGQPHLRPGPRRRPRGTSSASQPDPPPATAAVASPAPAARRGTATQNG